MGNAKTQSKRKAEEMPKDRQQVEKMPKDMLKERLR
jgi:hypothetical protein